MPPAQPGPATALEGLLRRERWLSGTGLLLVTAACWAWLVPTALDMYGAMDGPAAWMMRDGWSAGYALAILAMWLAMMTGMMLPSAAPTLLLYGRICRHSAIPTATLQVHLFAAGYLLAWGAFSVLATLLQWALSASALLNPMMELATPQAAAVVAIAAGIYQWTPAKQRCLAQCRSPAAFISRHWRPGPAGALQLGLRHGAWCLGCCWALMLLLFAGGVMSLAWIAGLTAWVLAEKLLPGGLLLGRAGGGLLVGWGLLRLLGLS
ncbi:MAG TPA: DUF2182 domain-containing protein [Solimonas sp.]|nr:DUF2182 domain-containing protein [Solimonas sp.]